VNSLEVQHLRLKHAATINYEILPEDTSPDYNLQYVDITNIDFFGNINKIVPYYFKDAPKRARRIVQKGDVLLSIVKPDYQTIALIHDVPENLIVSTDFAVIRPKETIFDSSFCKYVLQESALLNDIKKLSGDYVNPKINALMLGDININLPPIQQQRIIAKYLDHETSLLNRLVATNQRLIELLEEKEKALINYAVTRGLNPKVELKDSGLYWIGEIPAHWRVGKLKYLVTLKTGETIGIDSIKETGEYPVFGGNGQRGFTSSFTHEGQHILIGRHGFLGKNIQVISGQFWASEDVIVVSMNNDSDACWLRNMLSTVALYQYSESMIQSRINIDFISNLQIPIPPTTEQCSISRYIEAEMMKLDKLKEVAERTIALLKERHSAIITTALLGKIEVIRKHDN
jgi:type I restriction enzyme S subunit